MGNPINDNGQSLDPNGNTIDRRRYVQDRYGKLQKDLQRDRMYTQRLAEQISTCFYRDNIVLPTQLTAFACWELLKRKHPRLDDIQCATLNQHDSTLSRKEVLACISSLRKQLVRLYKNNQICLDLPTKPERILSEATRRFQSFHNVRAVQLNQSSVLVAPKLALYYGNRLQGYGLSIETPLGETS